MRVAHDSAACKNAAAAMDRSILASLAPDGRASLALATEMLGMEARDAVRRCLGGPLDIDAENRRARICPPLLMPPPEPKRFRINHGLRRQLHTSAPELADELSMLPGRTERTQRAQKQISLTMQMQGLYRTDDATGREVRYEDARNMMIGH